MKHTLTILAITSCFITSALSQNVGVGTTNPKVRLHVVKDAALVDPYFGSTMAIQSNGETLMHILSGSYEDQGAILFGNTQQPISAGIQFNTFTPNDLTFYTNASLATFSINNAGNIGVHTVTAKSAFNVAAGKTVLFGSDTSGEGSKMIWYPSKSAFRVGYTFENRWDFNNIGRYSFASGYSTIASGEYSTAMGGFSNASGDYSTAIGASIASGYNSTAMGESIASAAYSTAIGGSTASGNNSAAMVLSTASGDYSIAMGAGIASGEFSTAVGGGNASGYNSRAMGNYSSSSGDFSTAMGNSIIAKSYNETSLGSYNTNYTPLSATSWNAGDRLFTIGNGINSSSRSDAMVVLKNGNTGIGTSMPAYKLDVAGDINASGLVRANGVALTSDARFKQNIRPIPNALNNLLQLTGTSYFYNTNAFPERNFSGDKQMGVVAQEVEKVFPELVSTDKDGYKSVNYIGLIPVMIESIKTLQKEIDELKKKIK